MNKLPESKLTKSQQLIIDGMAKYDNEQPKHVLSIHYDDKCGNGHNTFTLSIEHLNRKGEMIDWSRDSKKFDRYFPKYKKYLKWHLMSSNGPLHYIEDTIFHASNRDCYGLLKGEIHRTEKRIKFDNVPYLFEYPKVVWDFIELMEWLNPDNQSPCFDLEIISMHHDKGDDYLPPKFYISGMDVEKWHQAPFNSSDEAGCFLAAMMQCEKEVVEIPVSWGKGKERDLDAARRCAVWSNAPVEDLLQPKEVLTEILQKRLPALIEEFKADIEELGLVF